VSEVENDAELTIERIFDTPPLEGAVARQTRYAPDASRIAYLKPAADDYERLDLWIFDRETARARTLVTASDLSTETVELSDQEKARRERTRTSAKGIVEYQWLPDGKRIVFPLDGVAHSVDVATGELRALTPTDRFVTHLKPSPNGRWLAFLSDSDLHVVELGTGEIRQITIDGSDAVSNGLADFIAQEEMHRYEGYWWSPDEEHIAFTRVDEGPIAPSQRYEINAGEITIHPQRYPYAGESNARVDLRVVEISSGRVADIPWQLTDEDYLARAWWLTGNELAILRQRRDQKTMELMSADLEGHTRKLLSEASATWLNLNDDFAYLASEDAFVWGSERSGQKQLYLHRTNGGRAKTLTPEDVQVSKLVDVDETRRVAFFQGWRGDPAQQHLFRVSLDTNDLVQLTSEVGCHDISVSPDRNSWLDEHSSVVRPPCVVLRRADGGQDVAIDANEMNEAHPYAPFMDSHCVPEFGQLEAEDGQTLHYRITRPPKASSEPQPAIVMVYGGPGVQRVRNQWPPPTHQFFARAGYVIMELDNRGSANRGHDFEAPIHRRLGEVEVRDQVAGARHLAALPDVDGDRIGVFGHSYGGYMAIMCLAKASSLFRCGVAVAPVTDWKLYDTHYTERYLERPQDNPDGYRASSVFPYLENLRGGLLLMHGMADDNVLFTHTTQLIRALQEQGTLFELMTYPGAKHGLGGRGVSVHRYRVIADFFERHLKR
jgi:dipeptidyl-peptidase-4